MGSLSRLAIQRLATVGNLASGGVDAAEAGVYAPVATWADLATVPGERRNGDNAEVTDADGSGSAGTAVYVSGAWFLLSAEFASCLLMDTFPNPVLPGATCTIGTTTGPEVYRYQTFGTGVYYWAHSSVPDTLTRRAWGIGTEEDAALTSQGYTVTETGSTVAPVNGYTVLTGGGSSGNQALLALTGVSPTSSTVLYFRALARSGTTGTLGRGLQIFDGSVSTRPYFIGTGGIDFYGTDGVTPTTGGVSRLATLLPGASSDPALFELLDRGRTELTTIRINGAVALQYRRNVGPASALQLARWVAQQSTTLQLRNHMGATS